MRLLLALLRQYSWSEWRHHPWRHGAALIAVMLGVALAFSVQLINQSALGEFSAAVRSVSGQPDLQLTGQRTGFDESLYARVVSQPGVDLASPVIELDAEALDAKGDPVPLKILGIDALVAPAIAPALLPRPDEGSGRLSILQPNTVFLNPQAARLLPPTILRVKTAEKPVALHIAGSLTAEGPALAVMDIAGAQALFGWQGRLSRIDIKLKPGIDRGTLLKSWVLPPEVHVSSPDDATQRVSQVSRAYRVNLTVLALVALFTGAFLVFSILSLSVAKRLPQLALLGVLGMSARERLLLVLIESALLGAIGSALGLMLGTGLAAAALRLLAGDLGGGYFIGVAPRLQFDPVAAAVYGVLGIVAAMVGGWLPARNAQRIAPAQALKGLGSGDNRPAAAWPGPLLILLGVALAESPPIGGIPLAAYLGVASLLIGGIVCVPAGVAAILRWVAPPRNPLALLAVERARHQRHTATVAVAGVVASLSLAVALTVMVTSFREAVIGWLDTVLPADLYLRASETARAGDLSTLPPGLPDRAAAIDGVARVEAQRVILLQLSPVQPAVALIARPLPDPARQLPLVGDMAPARPGVVSAYVSQAMVDLYDARVGTLLDLPLPGHPIRVVVRGVWRDYARQHGAITIDASDYQRLTGDTRINDMAVWLQANANAASVEQALRAQASALGGEGQSLDLASAADIRRISLRIFDRSFAVTYWLQAVAIGIGLFGIAASFSAQVLARRKEFGLLAHLGFTRRQVLTVVAAEGALWTGVGALLGLALGIAVSVVLVKVVNPQSFHWTMDLLLPWPRLILLCGTVLVAGTLTAWLAARSAASQQMALAVKEDW